MPRKCGVCGGLNILFDGGATICPDCGHVLEEGAIVAEVTFGESSSGAAMAHGKNVPVGADRAGGGGPETRQQVIENGKKKIREVASVMGIGPNVVTRAFRYFNLCVTNDFIKGRSSVRVAAACLYITCRELKTSHMLIDFSDKLRINVFELGATYTKLVRSLHLKDAAIPLVDPAHYVGRFAALLEFGDDTPVVANDALRLIRRFKTDWLDLGRRPSGICGAALLLAARMNNFRRSVEEIVQVVKIADSTIKKRLEEFKNTPSGGLTLDQFRKMWLEEAVDPPAFTKGREKRLREDEALAVGLSGEGDEEEGNDADDEERDEAELSRARKRQKRGRSQSREVSSTPAPAITTSPSPNSPKKYGRLVSISSLSPEPEADPIREAFVATNAPFLSALEPSSALTSEPANDTLSIDPTLIQMQEDNAEEEEDELYRHLREEVEERVLSGEGLAEEYARIKATKLSQANNPRVFSGATLVGLETADVGDAEMRESVPPSNLDEGAEAGDEEDNAEENADPEESAEPEVIDTFSDVDDDEISKYLCTKEEAKRKARIWVEFNREYLETKASQGVDEQSGIKSNKKRNKPTKPKDSSTPVATNVGEAATIVLRKKAISKRINYNVVEHLFSREIKDKRPKKKSKKSGGQENRGGGDADLSGSGLERMDTTDDEGMSWINAKASTSGPETVAPFEATGDGYESDDYQQEA